MTLMPETDRERITAAVRAAEAKTRAEFIAVIAPRADRYLAIPLLSAIALTLLVPGLAWHAGLAEDFAVLYALQLLVFEGAAPLFLWQRVAVRLVPGAILAARAQRFAREQFHLRGLNATPECTGVLFFVSLAERYVEIIADQGAHAAVPPGTWPSIVSTFTAKVRTGQTVAGYEAAIAAVGEALAAKLPRRPGDANLIPDRLVEL